MLKCSRAEAGLSLQVVGHNRRCVQLRDQGLTVAGTSLIKRVESGTVNLNKYRGYSEVAKKVILNDSSVRSSVDMIIVLGVRSAVVRIESLSLLVQAVDG